MTESDTNPKDGVSRADRRTYIVVGVIIAIITVLQLIVLF